MRGGHLIAFVDALSVNMQEAEGEGTVALPVETNIEDLFFRYGIRVNRDYLADLNCGNTPVVTGMVGDQPRIELLPCPYFPIITGYQNHPLVRNMDASLFRGVSTMDTVKAIGISKTPLMRTSEYTRVFTPPVRISYNDLQEKLRPEYFTSGRKVVGYLLEGKFTSLYKNRFPPKGFNRDEMIEDGLEESSVIVVSDGDYVRNDFNLESGNPLPMGMDPYSQTTYANGDFLMNALDYMLDDGALMAARNREVRIRPLDRVRVQEDGDYWKWFNMIAPVMAILLLGGVKRLLKKRKYQQS
jgi:gliding-associated putative ABC transporter substrate-binding component GldG